MSVSSIAQPTDLAGSLNHWFHNMTHARPSLSSVVNNEAAIQRGHAERRLQLAQRRAVQQLEILMLASQRLGVTLSTDAMARTCIAAYTDTMKVARR
jgi:hypothetical protein